MYQFKHFAILHFMLVVFSTSASEQMETITVYGDRTSSWKVSCAGIACKSSANQLSDTINELMKKYHVDAPPDYELRQDFCSMMRFRMPKHCSVYRPKAITPGRDPYLFQFKLQVPSLANGCGTGSSLEGLASRIIKIEGFTGDLDAPAGPSFRAACDNHDRCYASTLAQSSCDGAFKKQMYSACSSDDRCLEIADLYYGLVRGVGYRAKAEAEKQQQCRTFSNDYDRNCTGVSGTTTKT